MYKKNIIIFIFLFAYGSLYAEEDGVIDRVKQILSDFSETKELKNEYIINRNKNNDGNNNDENEANLLEQIYSVIENYELDGNISKIENDTVDSVPDIHLTANANAVTIRDPFNLSTQIGGNRSGGYSFGSSFLPVSNSKIPTLKLRGVIHPKSNESNNSSELLALLEVGKTDVHMVRIGDEISYDPANPNAAIKIININRLTVTVQAGSLGNVLIIR